MTLNRTILTLLAAASPVCVAEEFIRQTQLSSGLTWDFHPVPGQKSTWSPVPVDQGGSRISLYAIADEFSPKILKLDQTTIGSSFPTVELTIKSQDHHIPARTRADQPFTVSIKRQGASDTVISLKHSREKYNPATHSHDIRSVKQHDWWQLPLKAQQSGKFLPTVPTTKPTQAEGEETFAAYVHGSDGKILHPLRSSSIQVWPVASVSITGIKANATVKSTEQLKNVTVHCQDLYPDSVTYVQIYRGVQRLGTVGKILQQTVIRFDTEVPQNQKIPLGNWANTLHDGKYTMEVLHITPFNQRKPERLTHLSFVIDRGMHASGLVHHQPKVPHR